MNLVMVGNRSFGRGMAHIPGGCFGLLYPENKGVLCSHFGTGSFILGGHKKRIVGYRVIRVRVLLLLPYTIYLRYACYSSLYTTVSPSRTATYT